MLKSTILTILTILTLGMCVNGQTVIPQYGTMTLESRYVDKQTSDDNYVKAAYSFEKAVNGFEGIKKTRNDWDVLFSTI